MMTVMAPINKSKRTYLATLLDEYAPKSDVASAFNVSDRTIERWVRLRLLPAPIKLGRTSLFHIPTIKKALANGGVGPRSRDRRR